MDFKISFFFLIFILFFSVVSAVSFENHDEYLKGENVVVKVSGNFVGTVNENNVYFYRRHMQSTFDNFQVIKIDSDYYINFQIPLEKIADDYSIWLKNIEYNNGIEVVDTDVYSNFTILDSVAAFTFTPAMIETEEDYSVNLRSFSPSDITVSYGENMSVNLIPGEEKIVDFKITEFPDKIEFNSMNETYDFLVFSNVEKVVAPEIIVGNETEENITQENESIVPEENESVVPEENKTPGGEENSAAYAQSCEEINATVCQSGFKCEGETKLSVDSVCCIGECIEEKKSSTGKTIGWILIIAIVLFLTWFFKNKYLGAKPPKVNLEKVSRGRKK